jgi:tetratricopeptide (TPR) repeat protein
MFRSMRTWLIVGLGLLLILALLLPRQAVLFAGAAAGWALAVTFIFRSRERMDYQKAVRHMRRGEYSQAIKVMDKVIEHHPASRDGYIGLAEIALQRGDYHRARKHASAALERDTNGWAAAYNLGLIEDRLRDSEAVIDHLQTALTSGLPDRYQLLARLWLARNYHRLGRDDLAEKEIALLRKEKKGLREWQVILDSDQGTVLRDLLERDVKLAQELLESRVTLAALD